MGLAHFSMKPWHFPQLVLALSLLVVEISGRNSQKGILLSLRIFATNVTINTYLKNGMHGGLIVTRSSLDQVVRVRALAMDVALCSCQGKTGYSHSASPHPGVF